MRKYVYPNSIILSAQTSNNALQAVHMTNGDRSDVANVLPQMHVPSSAQLQQVHLRGRRRAIRSLTGMQVRRRRRIVQRERARLEEDAGNPNEQLADNFEEISLAEGKPDKGTSNIDKGKQAIWGETSEAKEPEGRTLQTTARFAPAGGLPLTRERLEARNAVPIEWAIYQDDAAIITREVPSLEPGIRVTFTLALKKAIPPEGRFHRFTHYFYSLTIEVPSESAACLSRNLVQTIQADAAIQVRATVIERRGAGALLRARLIGPTDGPKVVILGADGYRVRTGVAVEHNPEVIQNLIRSWHPAVTRRSAITCGGSYAQGQQQGLVSAQEDAMRLDAPPVQEAQAQGSE